MNQEWYKHVAFYCLDNPQIWCVIISTIQLHSRSGLFGDVNPQHAKFEHTHHSVCVYTKFVHIPLIAYNITIRYNGTPLSNLTWEWILAIQGNTWWLRQWSVYIPHRSRIVLNLQQDTHTRRNTQERSNTSQELQGILHITPLVRTYTAWRVCIHSKLCIHIMFVYNNIVCL